MHKKTLGSMLLDSVSKYPVSSCHGAQLEMDTVNSEWWLMVDHDKNYV